MSDDVEVLNKNDDQDVKNNNYNGAVAGLVGVNANVALGASEASSNAEDSHNDGSNVHSDPVTMGDNGVLAQKGGEALLDSKNELIDVDEEIMDIEDDIDDAVALAQAVAQYMSGDGNDNAINITQVNNLVDNDDLYNPDVKFDIDGGCCPDDIKFDDHSDYNVGMGSGFVQYAFATGQSGEDADVKAHNTESDIGDLTGDATASADTIVEQSAFNQTITMGGNIQANSVDISVIGGDSTIADDL